MSHPVFVPAPLGRRRPSTEPATWNERLAALRYVPALFRLIWRTHRRYATAMIVLRVARSVVPVTTFWVGKLILDSVIAAKPHHLHLGSAIHQRILDLIRDDACSLLGNNTQMFGVEICQCEMLDPALVLKVRKMLECVEVASVVVFPPVELQQVE